MVACFSTVCKSKAHNLIQVTLSSLVVQVTKLTDRHTKQVTDMLTSTCAIDTPTYDNIMCEIPPQ